MKISVMRYLGSPPLKVDIENAFAVVLKNDRSLEPMAVYYEVQPGVIMLSKRGDPDFVSCLEAMGYVDDERVEDLSSKNV